MTLDRELWEQQVRAFLGNADPDVDAISPEGVDAILSLARPSIRLIEAPDAAVSTVACKLGGLPDLPLDARWPDAKGRPQTFMAQINLQTTAPFDVEGLLPTSGLVSFFYDFDGGWGGYEPEARGDWTVLYTPELVQLKGLEPRGERGSSFMMLPTTPVEPRPDLTLPDYESLAMDTISLTPDEQHSYRFKIREDEGEVITHRMLGHDQPIQEDMTVTCQLASNGINVHRDRDTPRAEELKPGASDWELLLQLDAESIQSWLPGGVGRFYYWIKRQDLAKADFGETWFQFQGS